MDALDGLEEISKGTLKAAKEDLQGDHLLGQREQMLEGLA